MTDQKISNHGILAASQQKDTSGCLFNDLFKHLISLHLFYRSAGSVSSSGSTQVNFTARECFVIRFARVDAHIALTAKGAKDGLNFPRFTRAFEDT